MLMHTFRAARSPPARILRLPLLTSNPPPAVRPFTYSSTQLLIIAPRAPRPQLPYLASPTYRHGPVPFHQYHLRRLLSTATKKYVIEQTWLGFKYAVLFYVVLGLGALVWYGVDATLAEMEEATPEEFGLEFRQRLRDARAELAPQLLESRGYINYGQAANHLRRLLKALENRSVLGAGLEHGGDLLVPGVGFAGIDFSAKSWPWRAGYVETVMSLAKCAEHAENLVFDKASKKVFEADCVIGPSNPDPRPLPKQVLSPPPREENCVPLLRSPGQYYLRIVTGRGLLRKHKLDAMLAWANWLDYKGHREGAMELHKMAMDLALAGLPAGVDAQALVDKDTGVIKQTEGVTPNVLAVSTSLATHHARVGDVAAALPIFLSVLRARRAAPVSAIPHPPAQIDAPPVQVGFPDNLFPRSAFPPPPPSGDDVFTRPSERPNCEDAALMAYIGEILFASAANGKTRAASEDEGLGWTRQAVTIAEEYLRQSAAATASDKAIMAERAKCKECLVTGVQNWATMLDRLEASPRANMDHKGWFGRSNPDVAQTQAVVRADRRRVTALQEALEREKNKG